LIAVLASELDEAACGLVDAWSRAGAVLISAPDLCTRGWVFDPLLATDGTFVAGGSPHPVTHLRGVVVRRPAVAAEELTWIIEEDRRYVAAEINAFLVAWLGALRCSVLNRPSATSLSGPAWSQTSWQLAAGRANVPWSTRGRARTQEEMIYCAGRCHGASNTRKRHAAERLSAVSGAQLLGLRFAGDAVVAVTAHPRLADQGARDIVLAHLQATSA
jgi:hypothetical protein